MMDPHEKLKEARSIKEEGNGYYKRGILPEAQKSYTHVLDMLREEITFTGDDQKKERESLTLAAHLNLAQCALELGDYVKVIDHCNTALGLDSNNVKAHFRRAKAFENQSEYAKALEGYQTVLRLEPNNSAAQKQQSECQKRFVRERSMEEMSDNTGVIEVEMINESLEGDFESFFTKCKKNPGHKMFIDVTDFKIDHLPPGYRDEVLFAFLKLQSHLTVLVEVKGSSEHRPDYDPMSGDKYPFSGRRYRKSTHRGTGLVRSVDLNEGEKLCPCTTCQSSGLPEKRWAQIYVTTARHVVYDETEAKNTVCYFFYDTEVPLKSCPTICNGVETSGSVADNSTLIFISHNQKLIDILYNERNLCDQLLYKVDKKYKRSSVTEGTDILDRCFHNIQRLHEILTELRDVMDRSMAIYNGNPATQYQKCLAKHRTPGVSGWLGHLLLDKLNGGSEFQRLMKDLWLCYKSYETQASEFKNAAISINAIRLGHLPLTEQTRGELEAEDIRLDIIVKRMEKVMNMFRSLLADDEALPARRMDDYSKAHPLAIIVSHPHGLSKKISIGEVTDRHVHRWGFLARFIYSTPTCPGSSGAAVFILGQRRYSVEPTHSCGRSVKPGDKQQNMSVFEN